NIVQSYRRTQGMAVGWATPGSAYYQDSDVLDKAVWALRRMNELVYAEGLEPYGNWWTWESGAARSIADNMALLRDHIDPADLSAYCAALDYYVPDPWYNQHNRATPAPVSTGAN